MTDRPRSVLVNGFGAYHGGIVRVHNAICRALVDAGYDVSVASAPRAQQEIVGLTILSRQSDSRRHSLMDDVRASLRPRRFDVRIDSAPAFRLLTFAARRCVVVHDLNFLDPATHQISSRQLWYRRALNAWELLRSDLVVVNSAATRAEVVGYLPAAAHKLRVLPLPAELPSNGKRWAPRAPKDGTVRLLTFGHARNKGVAHLLALMAHDDDVRLRVIATPEQWAEHWSAQATTWGVGERVQVISGLSDEELVNEYLACDVFCMLSSYEGYGLPVAEALSLGVPTLISSLDVLEQTARGYAVVAGDLASAGLTASLAEARTRDLRHWSEAADALGRPSWSTWVHDLMEAFHG